jgi:hypothetical protein
MGTTRQVYRTTYFANILLNNPSLAKAQEIRKALGKKSLQGVHEKVQLCAFFELILTGAQQGASSLSWST